MSGRIGFCLLGFFWNHWGRRLISFFPYHQESNLRTGMVREIKSIASFQNYRIECNSIWFFFVFLVGERDFFRQWEKTVPATKRTSEYARGYVCACLALATLLRHCELGVWEQVPLPFYVCVHLPQTSISVETLRDLQAIILVERTLIPGVIFMSKIIWRN